MFMPALWKVVSNACRIAWPSCEKESPTHKQRIARQRKEQNAYARIPESNPENAITGSLARLIVNKSYAVRDSDLLARAYVYGECPKTQR